MLHELKGDGNFAKWFGTALRTGRALTINDDAITAEENRLKQQQKRLKSDDPHVIALANVSGARILFTKDQLLQSDFRKIHGKNYSTEVHTEIHATHKSLLKRNVCFGQCA